MSSIADASPRREVVHEAEVQRQHARFKFPLFVEFDGASHRAADWSMGGVGVLGVTTDRPVGTVLPIRLVYPLDAYDLSIDLEGEVRYVDLAAGRMGLRFVETDMRRQAMMRHILESYVAGDLVDAGDVLEVARRTMSAPARKGGTGDGKVKRRVGLGQIVPVALLAAMTAGVLWLIGTNVYDRSFVIVPKSAAIAGDSTVMVAPVQGQVAALVSGGSVKAAGPLAEIRTGAGEAIPVPSPCDCEVVRSFVTEGSYVRDQTPIALLAPSGSRQYVSADVSLDDLPRLFDGAVVQVEFLDGTVIRTATIADLPPVLPGSASLPIRIDPGIELPKERIGEPVLVRFDTAPFRLP